MTTTLNNIRKHSPCEASWKALLLSLNKTEADDDPLQLQHILDTLGVQDAIWSLRSLEGADREMRLFACDCAESVLPLFDAEYPDDMRLRQAIDVSRRYANGEATVGELAAARAASWAAAWAAARAAAGSAWAAGDASGGAKGAAWAAAEAAAGDAWAAAAWAAGATEREKQTELFIQYFC